jgi:hypothetical protein
MRKKYIDYFIFLIKLIIYTRDIFVGKGERDLTYMMIYTLYTQFPILAIYTLKTIIFKNEIIALIFSCETRALP